MTNSDEFLWRAESIRAAVVRDDEHFFGQFLDLDQALRPGEGGWMNMKIFLPDSWQVESVLITDDGFLLALSDGSEYALQRSDIGELSFELSDGGPGKSAEILERIWNRYRR